MNAVADFLSQHPVFVLFTCISIGFLVGRVSVKTFRLGGICGTLLVALVLGQAGVQVAPGTSGLAFSLFIFSLGYLAGPQFFASLTRRDVRLLIFPLIEVVVAVPVVLGAAKLLGLGPGGAAGLFAGGASQSAALGTTVEALDRSGLTGVALAHQQADLAGVYSLSYLCGLIAMVVFAGQLAPALLRLDPTPGAPALPRAARTPYPSTTEEDTLDLVGRVYRVEEAVGSVAALERRSGGLVVAGILRDDAVLARADQLPLRSGDLVRVVGHRRALLAAAVHLGREVACPPGLSGPLRTVDVMITRHRLRARGPYLDALLSGHDDLAVVELRRGGRPVTPADTAVRPGDVVTLLGATGSNDRVVTDLGRPVDRDARVDFTFLGAGLAVGILVGLPEFRWRAVDLTIGTGGGALIAGLCCGWLRTKRAAVGAYDAAAAEVVKDLGLALFIGIIGLTAAPQLAGLIHRFGPALLLSAVVVSLAPAATALLIGVAVLRLPSPLALGAVAGQQSSGAALTAVQHRVGDHAPLVSYMSVYAAGCVLLPMLGPVIVALVPLQP